MAKLTEAQKKALTETILEGIELIGPYGTLTITMDSDSVATIEANKSTLLWAGGKRLQPKRAM